MGDGVDRFGKGISVDWQAMRSEVAKTRRAAVECENGCEKCWDAFRAEHPNHPEPWIGHYPAEWVERPCPHDAPGYAPSILMEVDDSVEDMD